MIRAIVRKLASIVGVSEPAMRIVEELPSIQIVHIKDMTDAEAF